MANSPYVPQNRRLVAVSQPQEQWGFLIALAFFFGKIGAGSFFMATLLRLPAAAWLGIGLVLLGKGGAHILYLGRPERFWRALARPGISWVSRGLWAMVVFTVTGILSLYLSPESLSGMLMQGIAMMAAFILMVYDGLLLTSSPAIPLWDTALMPVLCISYSFLGGTTLTLLFESSLKHAGSGSALEGLDMLLGGVNLVLILLYIITLSRATLTARESLKELLSTYVVPFIGGVLLVGIGVTILLGMLLIRTEQVAYAYLLTATDLLGHFLIFYLLLRAAKFSAPGGLR